jgi:hypothetical protein
MDTARPFLRHALATLAYRAGKVIRSGSEATAGFDAGAGCRTPVEIVAHWGDILSWALRLAEGNERWIGSEPASWDTEVERFYSTLKQLDDYLASDAPLHAPAASLLQGPIADALTHVGQLAMLLRLAGTPVKGENYYKAAIVAGRVGREQEAPAYEF